MISHILQGRKWGQQHPQYCFLNVPMEFPPAWYQFQTFSLLSLAFAAFFICHWSILALAAICFCWIALNSVESRLHLVRERSIAIVKKATSDCDGMAASKSAALRDYRGSTNKENEPTTQHRQRYTRGDGLFKVRRSDSDQLKISDWTNRKT